MGNAGFIPSTLNPKPQSPTDPLKEALKGTLTDPFKGTPGFISSTLNPKLLNLLAQWREHARPPLVQKTLQITLAGCRFGAVWV